MTVFSNAVWILGSPVRTDFMAEGFIVVETGNEFIHFIRNVQVAGVILDEGTKEKIIGVLGEVTCNGIRWELTGCRSNQKRRLVHNKWMSRSNDSTKNVIPLAVVVGDSLGHGTVGREGLGMGKSIKNGQRPVSLLETKFPGYIILDKIGIIPNSEASSGIGVAAKTEIRLNKNAIRRTVVTEDIVPKSNSSITVVVAWWDVLMKFSESLSSLRSKIEHTTIASY